MKTTVLLGSILLAVATALAQQPTVNAQPNTVYAGGDGKYETAPDTAEMQFSISDQESTSKAAYDRVSQSAEKVRQILRANGIEPKAAEIGFYSTSPVYDFKDPKRKLIGYRVTTNVTLKVKDFGKLPALLQQLSESGAAESVNLNYTLEQTDAAKSKAVEDAYRRARESAEAVARASGRTLGELSYAAVDVSENTRMPVAFMKVSNASMNAPAPTEEFTPQNVTVNAHVNALFILK
ncbi:MAG TPA: SIMPL domain-containing protein [Terriglobales bacterium]|jgi:hypothetical protein